MGKYGISRQIASGVKNIISLNEDEVKFLSDIFINAKPGEEVQSVADQIPENFHELNNIEISELTLALFSIANTFFFSESPIELFIEEFSNSYKAFFKSASIEDLDTFKKNISILLPSFNFSIKKTIKARDLIVENANNFTDARIVSDIRIVYDDDSEMSKTEQNALVVHFLRITYFGSGNAENEFFTALDVADLRKLQKVINRALEKDELIRTNNHELTFINFK